MSAELLARLGGPAGAAGLGLLVLAAPRWARLAGIALWALGLALFVPLLAPSGHAALLAAGAALGVVVALGLGVLFRRTPWALAFLTLAAVPARIPVSVGDISANLLVPLYAVIGGAALALAWSLWRDPPRRRELGGLSWPLALLVAWVGLSALWTNDPREGGVELLFFFLPFTLLAVALARLPWSELVLGWLARLLLAMGLVFAAVGAWQWAAKDVFWNPRVMAGNAYARFFRVNSLFWDPSMYGRFLVVAILVSLVLLLFGLRRRLDLPLVGAVVVLWLGLLVSFSQSSFAALVAGVLVAAGLAWRWRAVAAVGLVAAVMIPAGVAAPQLRNVRHSVVAGSATGLDRATRGRFELIWNGVRIAADHPIVGIGVGGFKRAYAERVDVSKSSGEPASHTTPVTVAAETGVVGLALFGWLVAAALLAALRGPGPPSARLAGIAAGVGLAAVFVHSLFYNAFFEDPLVWGFFALAALAARENGARAARLSRSA